jgi:hypothetical protein
MLGMRLRRDRKAHAFFISQEQAIEDLLLATNMSNCTPRSTPMDSRLKLSSEQSPTKDSPEWMRMQEVPYRETVGSLIHLMRSSRPDLAFSVSLVSRYMHNPGINSLASSVEYSPLSPGHIRSRVCCRSTRWQFYSWCSSRGPGTRSSQFAYRLQRC